MEIHIVNLQITLTATQEKAEYFLEELSRDPIYSDLIFLFPTLFHFWITQWKSDSYLPEIS
jgi:hypothetical protein